MKHLLLTIVAMAAMCIAAHASGGVKADADGADICVVVDGYSQKPVVLGYYFNNQMLVKDTVMTDASGAAVFANSTNYPEGVYVVYLPDKSYFDIMLGSDQTFTLYCDTTADVSNVKVEGCHMLSDFMSYQQFLSGMQRRYKELSEQYKALPTDAAEQREAVREEYKNCDAKVKEMNEEMINAHKDDFLSVFLTALKDVQIPDFDIPQSEKSDSILQAKRYYYYCDHYFDNLDLTDDRLLRTPFFVSKFDKYFNEVLAQVPDTVTQYAIKVIEQTRSNKEMFRYVVSHLYNMANNSKVMGMDAMLVAIADRYYLTGEADWAEQKFLDELSEQIESLRYTLIGKKAVDMNMISITGEWFKLSEVDAPFTILVFWEPSCGHCKKEVPALKEKVYDKYAKYGVKFYAVYCQADREEWGDFIAEHQLEEWMNVYDPYGRSGFRKFYNIKSTPQIYVLDKDKTIIAKKIGSDQLPGFLDYMMTAGGGEQ